MKRILTSILTSAVVVAGALGNTASAAGSASFSLSPASGSYLQNSSFNVSVSQNGAAHAVTAKLAYDASKLTCNGVSNSFGSTIEAVCGGGTVTISGFVTGGATGSGPVGTINFTAIADSGSTSVSVAAGSQIANSGTNIWNGVQTSTTFGLSAPITPTPTPTPTPSPTPAPSAGSTASTKKTTTTASLNASSAIQESTEANSDDVASDAQVAGDTTVDAQGDESTNTETPAVDDNKESEASSNTGWIVGGLLAAAAVGGTYYYTSRNGSVAPVTSDSAVKPKKTSAKK